MIETGERSMSKAFAEGAVRRVEIFTGAGRRRRWPAAVKAAIVAKSFSGTVTVSEVGRRHGLSGAQLFAWRREARLGSAAGSVGCRDDRPFVPVVMSMSEDTAAGAPVSGGLVAITVAGAAPHIPAGVEPAPVTALIRAIRAAS